MKKNAIKLLVFLMVLLASCGGAVATSSPLYQSNLGMSAMDEAAAPPRAAIDSEEYAEPAAPAEAPAPETAAGQDRIVIMDATRTLVVEDPSDAAKKIADMAVAKGGFVAYSNIQSTYDRNGEKYYTGSIKIRVPAETLDQTLLEIDALAVEVKTRQLIGQDVTAEYTDLQARIRNLEASQSRLREIMTEAVGTKGVTDVESQLRQVEEQIEVLKGQIRYYDESSRYSSVTVTLEPYIPSQPIEIGGWHPEGVAKEALEDLVRGLQQLVDLLIQFVICGVPILILIGLVLTPVALVIRARNRRYRAQKS
jgi:hypothetical protein